MLGGRPASRCRSWCPTSAASTGRWRSGAARRDLRQRHRDLRTAQPQPRPRRAVRDVRARRRPRAGRRRWTSAPTSRCASATRGRATCRSRRSCDVGKRLLDLGASQLSLGDTIGVGTAGPRAGRSLAAFAEAGVGRRAAGRALPRHLRPGARQHPAALEAGITTFDASRRRPRRLPLRRERHRQPRHRGPGLDAGRPRHRARRRPRARWWPRARGWPGSSGARARQRWSARSPDTPCGRIDRMTEAGGVYLHIGAPKTGTTYVQDRLTRNASSLRKRGVRPPDVVPDRLAGPLPLPSGARRARPGLGRLARARRGRLGHACSSGSGARRDRSWSATRSSRPHHRTHRADRR